MNIEVDVKIKVRGYSEDYKLFLENLSTLEIEYKSEYYLQPQKFDICLNNEELKLNYIFSLTNNTIEGYNDIFNKESIGYTAIPGEFEMRLFDLLLAIQISRPGEIDFYDMVIYKDDKSREVYYKKVVNPWFITTEFLDNNEKQKYYHQFDFKQVWDWLSNLAEFWDGMPKSKIGKALNYISYVFTQDSTLNIIWIIMALESLLVENQAYSKNQLYGKIITLHKYYHIQPFPKKQFDEFYKFRSKIIHGEQSFYRPNCYFSGNDVDLIDNKIMKFGRMAYEMLLLCMRYFIENNKYELCFDEIIEYRLK